MTKPLCALGMMSGTSLDGIDVALLITDGEHAVERRAHATYPYPADFRAQLRRALADATAITARGDRPGCLPEVERELTERHAVAVSDFLHAAALKPGEIDVIGMHGQTVLHRPADRLTVQLGDGSLLARLTGIDVVYDLRAADVAAGGQGAPLAPVYHRALAARTKERPVAFLNVGGVANITWIGASGELIAFDTGPGNALIDDFVRARTGQPFDRDGALTSSGKVDDGTVLHLLADPYFSAAPPKSLDRHSFAVDLPPGISLDDGAATLAACSAAAVARGCEWLPDAPALWVVCGGGRHNRGLMVALAARLGAAVAPVEVIGVDGDSLEAEAWAYMAVRSLDGLPITFPMTTGAPKPMTGGVLAKAQTA